MSVMVARYMSSLREVARVKVQIYDLELVCVSKNDFIKQNIMLHSFQ